MANAKQNAGSKKRNRDGDAVADAVADADENITLATPQENKARELINKLASIIVGNIPLHLSWVDVHKSWRQRVVDMCMTKFTLATRPFILELLRKRVADRSYKIRKQYTM